jgi:hypothetical protein
VYKTIALLKSLRFGFYGLGLWGLGSVQKAIALRTSLRFGYMVWDSGSSLRAENNIAALEFRVSGLGFRLCAESKSAAHGRRISAERLRVKCCVLEARV